MEFLSDILYEHRFEGVLSAFPDYLSTNERLITSMGPAMKLVGHKGCINTCAFNPFGDKLITGCDDGCVWIWDIETRDKKPKIMLQPHITNVFTTNFLSSNRFISGGNDATVQVVELTESGAKTTSFINHHIRKVLCSFVIDPNTFVTCSADETIRLFDIRQSYPSAEVHDLRILTMDDMNYNGGEKLSNDLTKYHLLPQSHGGGMIGRPPAAHNESLLLKTSSAQLYSMDVHPIDRKRFIASASDGTVRLFDLRAINGPTLTKNIGFSVREAYNSEKEITGCAFDEYGERIAATVLDGDIHVFETNNSYELDSWRPTPRRDDHNGRNVIDISQFITEDGSLDVNALYNATHAGRGRQRQQRRPLSQLEIPLYEEEEQTNEDQNQADHNEEEQHQEQQVEEEEEEEETPQAPGCIQVLSGHRSRETIKACNWFGDFVVTGSDNAIIYMYNVKTGKVRKVLKGHDGHVNVVAVHKQKRLLATSGIDDYAMLWEPNLFTIFDEAKNNTEIQEALEDASNPSIQLGCNVM